MTQRELVPTMIRTEFGEVLDDPKFYETMGAAMDHTFVEGYSNMRRERAKQMAEVAKGERKFQDVLKLPVRLHWARTSKVIGGQPDNTKEVSFASEGYRFVTENDIGSDWIKSLPQGAVITADKTIKKGDTTLMVCDAKIAARNAAINQKMVDRLTHDAPRTPLLSRGDATKGADPWFTAEPADHQIAAPKSAIK